MSGAENLKVDWRVAIPYGVGAIGSAAKSAPISALMMLYYNQVLGLSALTVATVLMVSMIFDAAFDPLIGQLSDNYQSLWGRRLPFMYTSALPIACFVILLWNPPSDWSDGALTAYLALCIMGVRFFDTLFELPHAALIPELTSDYDQRTKLFTIRSLFESLGGFAIMALAYNAFMKEEADGSGGLLARDGYTSFAWVTGAIIFTAIFVSTRLLHTRLKHVECVSARIISLRDHLREMIATLYSRPFFILAGAAVLIAIGSGVGSSLNSYWLFYFYRFSQAEMTMIAMPIMVGMLFAAMTPNVTAKFGKRNAAIILCWVYVCSSSLPVLVRIHGLLPHSSAEMLGLVMLQSALAPGSMIMLLITMSSMAADLVEEAEVRTHRRAEGLLLAANGLLRKATMGLGALGGGLILTAAEFPQSVERTEVPESILLEMGALYLTLKLLLFVGATALLLSYRYDKTAHNADLQKLARRRRSESSRNIGGEPEEMRVASQLNTTVGEGGR